MNNEQKQYLLQVYPNHRGKTMRGETLAVYYETEKILKNLPSINKRGCSCQYTAFAREIDNLYDQWFNSSNNQ